ncbi:MAG: protein-tyrosine-phosphatase [Vicingaceae bacterium]
MYQDIEEKIQDLKLIAPSPERLFALNQLIDYISYKRNNKQEVLLNFICTHNSRRSQMAQIWATLLAEYYGIKLKAFSGGTEATAFHPNALSVFRRLGLGIEKHGDENPHYVLKYSQDQPAVVAFSKIYHHSLNPTENFVAIMTCAEADVNCPFIPNADHRISLSYEDPKQFDETENAIEAYRACADLIASELKYVFENLES